MVQSSLRDADTLLPIPGLERPGYTHADATRRTPKLPANIQ